MSEPRGEYLKALPEMPPALRAFHREIRRPVETCGMEPLSRSVARLERSYDALRTLFDSMFSSMETWLRQSYLVPGGRDYAESVAEWMKRWKEARGLIEE